MVFTFCDCCGNQATKKNVQQPGAHWRMTDNGELLTFCVDCYEKVSTYIRKTINEGKIDLADALVFGMQWKMADTGEVINLSMKFCEIVSEYIREEIYNEELEVVTAKVEEEESEDDKDGE